MTKHRNLWPQRIDEFLSKVDSPTAYNQPEFNQIFYDLKNQGLLPKKVAFETFVETLAQAGQIEIARIRHVGKAKPSRKEFVRYNWRSPSPFTVALSLRSNSYLSHVTALYIHGLTDQIPKTIFVNKEQSAKAKTGSLTQAAIDRVFMNPVRQSQYIWAWERSRFVLLNGKNTDNEGVIGLTMERSEVITVTSIARTLIDCVVRPNYAGGVTQVVEAYKRAMGAVTGTMLSDTLRLLDYTYPYHQSIGFIMERAGFSPEETKCLQDFGLDFDFYLDYAMRDPEYDEKWRLFFPKRL